MKPTPRGPIIAAIVAAVLLFGCDPGSNSSSSGIQYSDIDQARKTMTNVQWEQYKTSILGKQIDTWRGKLANVRPSDGSDDLLSVDMDGDGLEDTGHTIEKSRSASFNIGATVEFQGATIFRVDLVEGRTAVYLLGGTITSP